MTHSQSHIGFLYVIGCAAIFLGTLDPMEGSVLILGGSGAILLSAIFAKNARETRYWGWVLFALLLGVGALWGISAVGGFGGRSGRSMWWGLILLPYPVGWFAAVRSIVAHIVNRYRRPQAAA